MRMAKNYRTTPYLHMRIAEWPIVSAAALTSVAVAGCGGARVPEAAEVDAGTAGVIVAAPVTRYPITATTVADMRAQVRRAGPTIDGRRWDGATRWTLRWQYSVAREATGCTVKDPRVYVTAAITMPEWIPTAEADDATKLWWRRYESGLMTHERGHAQIAVDAASAMRRALLASRAPTCDDLRQEIVAIGEQAVARLRGAQAAYDLQTRHGGTQITESLNADAP